MTPREIFREIARLADEQEFEQAKSLFEQAVAQLRQYGSVWKRLAVYCNAKFALYQNPYDAGSFHNLGTALEVLPEWFGEREVSLRAAETHYRTAIRLDPGRAYPHYGLANLMSDHPALFGEREASLRGAATHYRTAIRLDPGSAYPHNGLANLLKQHPALFGEC